jgi:DNA-binding beta-propeller fold protein YncE
MASPNGKFIYVGEYGTNRVGVVDTSVDERVAEYTASDQSAARRRTRSGITGDGKDLYATKTKARCKPTPGTLSRLDAATVEAVVGDPDRQTAERGPW